MKILMLSWEYPPHVVGGLAAHMQGLSRALVRRGHEVTVITQDAATEREQYDEGVRLHPDSAGTRASPISWGLCIN